MERILLEFIETLDATVKRLHRETGDGAGLSRLTISQLNYLDAIAALGEPTITEIAGRLNLTKASVTVSIQKLVDFGYVEKKQSEQDRRVYHVHLSAAGQSLVEAKTHALEEYVAFIRSALSEDEANQLEAIMAKLVKLFGSAS
jgi:DNA-binding MarR family transcriptional regulator